MALYNGSAGDSISIRNRTANRGCCCFMPPPDCARASSTHISLETALSDAGVISQAPMNWITLMSSGRRNTIRCGAWGTIEFVHTCRKPAELRDNLTYDVRCRMWRASVSLAMRDMRLTRRSLDLVNQEAAHDLV